MQACGEHWALGSPELTTLAEERHSLCFAVDTLTLHCLHNTGDAVDDAATSVVLDFAAVVVVDPRNLPLK